MKTLFAILSLTISMSAQAATFKSVRTLSGTAMENLGNLVSDIQANSKEMYGDASEVEALSYKSKPTESTLNTVKQLLMKKSLVNSEEVDAVSKVAVTETMVIETLLAFDENILDEEQKEQFDADLKKVLAALRSVSQYGVQLFQSGHSDEDGTWATLIVVDTENNEILLINSGSSGT